MIIGRFKKGLLCSMAVACALLATGTTAQTWSQKPITIVVGFAAGGPTDIVTRVVAKALGDELGKPVIVDNKPGAGATIAAAQVALSPNDGHTMLLVVPGLTGAESLFPNRKYDLTKDFAAVSLIGTSPNWLLTSAGSAFKDLQDVERLAKANPSKYSYGQGATGGISHLTSEWLNTSKGLSIVQVPYRGNGPALLDLAGGRIDMMFDQPISSEAFVTSGKLRPLAVTSPSRLPAYPDVPTMEESGYPGFVVEVWYGLAFPARTPAALINAVNVALRHGLGRNEVKASLLRAGVNPQTSTPEEFQLRIVSEIERWKQVINRANIKAQ
ncbi:Bug family tripartite tricarboxylate transporter substrate binding protein [Variovorax sp. N23]|uniref:Bug family tripartite tricarboxylate transporter substrate binding protein n=1 Tax=Variovorax sp. N23 TaxID=2980555 RepID=UPI0021C8AD65|nr:tripartite tricarboxylate transporter substrate binding protein [Variovorax sp. N23]MCU4119043.1 tripartite tricarboxylate transporter substrate binding protein [Variovorax sp. N23]